MMLQLAGAQLQPCPSVPLMITIITARAVSISGAYHWMRAERLDLRGMVDICGLNKCKCTLSPGEMIMGCAC